MRRWGCSRACGGSSSVVLQTSWLELVGLGAAAPAKALSEAEGAARGQQNRTSKTFNAAPVPCSQESLSGII